MPDMSNLIDPIGSTIYSLQSDHYWYACTCIDQPVIRMWIGLENVIKKICERWEQIGW